MIWERMSCICFELNFCFALPLDGTGSFLLKTGKFVTYQADLIAFLVSVAPICIDQEDINERCHQVQKMQRIYRRVNLVTT
jgi:hypothetical protein